jgi:putative N6-adenine-specific DNA methylase
MTTTLRLGAICLFGLEAVTAREIRQLGFGNVKLETGQVSFDSDWEGLARANLALRTAERVVILMGRFPAKSFTALFDGVNHIPWETLLPRDAAFPVKGYALKSQLFSVPDCQAIVKKAVAERLKAAYGCDWCSESGPTYQIRLALLKDDAMLCVDTSGTGLHKRGYRLQAAGAPIKETLAAGMVLLSRYQGREQLVDPFCGSGTIVIEAALIAAGRWPGLERTFAAERWPQLAPALWRDLRRQARQQEKSPSVQPLLGSDIDCSALELARENAARAGVRELVRFHEQDIAASNAPAYSLVVTNPPYGQRLLDNTRARQLIRQLGELAQKTRGPVYAVSPEKDFEHCYGRPADKKRKLYNGMIRCDLYMYYDKRSGVMRQIIRDPAQSNAYIPEKT